MADWDQVEGTLKEGAGKVTDDEEVETEGKVQGAWGDVKDAGGDFKDKAEDAGDDLKDRL